MLKMFKKLFLISLVIFVLSFTFFALINPLITNAYTITEELSIIGDLNISGTEVTLGSETFNQGKYMSFNLNQGGSKIYDDVHLHISTDDYLFLESRERVFVTTDLEVWGDVLANLFLGDLQGNVTGDVEGTVTGSLVGDVTGNVTGTSGGLTGTPSISVNNLSATGTVTLPNNSLSDTMIPNTITASNYLPLSGGTLIGNLNLNSNLLPNTTNTSNIGSASRVWSDIYATLVHGDLTGNVIGELTGNVTGDLIGNVTGNVSGTSGGLSGTPSIDISGLTMTVGASEGYTLTSDTNGVASWTDTSSTAGPWTLSGEFLYPDNTSYNVGIGTTTPTQKLQVEGNISATQSFITGEGMFYQEGLFYKNSGAKTTLGSNTWGVLTSNPSSGEDGSNRFQSFVLDSTYMYAVGFDSSPGNYQWRIEKRNKNTGVLVTAFDADGVIQEDISANKDEARGVAIDANYIYIAGYDGTLGATDYQVRIEKRDINTGVLVTAFDDDGIITRDTGINQELAINVHIQGDSLYIIGVEGGGSTDSQWFIEKRDSTTGALVIAFGNNGISYSNPKTAPDSSDYPYASRLDNNYIYIAGRDSTGPLGQTPIWRIEKRDLITGALIADFGNNGVIQEDIPGGFEELMHMDIDSDYIYLSGYDRNPGNGRIRLEKRDIQTGNLIAEFGESGVIAENLTSNWEIGRSIVVDDNYLYVSANDYIPGYRQWRYEKRDKDSGELINTFDGDGVIQTNINSHYGSIVMTLDNGFLYAFGADITLGDLQWRYEKRDAVSGALGGQQFLTNNIARMTIDYNGNLGIATDVPMAKLDVAGTVFLRGALTQTGLYVNSSGNVGIGTTSPEQKLEVNGGIKYNTATAKPTCNATTRGTTWFTQEAAGIKDNFEVCAKDAGDVYSWRTIY